MVKPVVRPSSSSSLLPSYFRTTTTTTKLSSRRKFRIGNLRWLLALLLLIYLYALYTASQITSSPGPDSPANNDGHNINQVALPNNNNDGDIKAKSRNKYNNNKIDIHNVVNNNNKNLLPSTVGKQKQKLQDKLDQIFIETGHPYDDGDLWEISDYAPHWMKEYMSWHKKQRQLMESNPTFSFSNHHFLVMQCIKTYDTKCGGTADRLKDFLFVLREAYITNRILLIYWTLPARLEEFVLPPKGGFDWRVPTWLQHKLDDPTIGRKIYKSDILIKDDIRQSNSTLIRTRIQSTTGLSEKYDPQIIDPTIEESFDNVYHDVWRIFFTPSIPVRQLIQQEIDRMQLIPGKYAAAHLRALYGRVTQREDSQATEWTRNAINCATSLYPGVSILFASDHTYSTEAAIQYGIEKGSKIVARQHNQLPLHLDNAENITTRKPEEFFDTWVDLYLMGMSRCVSYNRGGYGHWGLLIGYNASCGKNQRTSSKGIGTRCDWTDPVDIDNGDDANVKPSGAPLFLDAMFLGRSDTGVSRQLIATPIPSWISNYSKYHQEMKMKNASHIEPAMNNASFATIDTRDEGNVKAGSGQIVANHLLNASLPYTTQQLQRQQKPEDSLPQTIVSSFGGINDMKVTNREEAAQVEGKARTEANNLISINSTTYILPVVSPFKPGRNISTSNLSSKLPRWMTEYLDWHEKTRKSLSTWNWNSTKYMIMSCYKNDLSCGGIGDRLKPLPAIILKAALTQRMLFIMWERPKPLESWLQPPLGGFDWRLPEWLKPLLGRKSRRWRSMQLKDMDTRLNYSPNETTLWLRIQTPDGGEGFYGNHSHSESTYAGVFHSLFRLAFRPVPRLQAAIDKQMQINGLVPGEYAAAHFRCMYGNRKWRDPMETIAVTVNGINCASNLLPGSSVYFASDVKFAVDVAKEYGQENSLLVASLDLNSTDSPSHFDKDPDWQERNASYYDDTFLDLLMLAESKCVAYSNGGYGTFGSLLSYDATCTDRFFKSRKIVKRFNWMYADGSEQRLPLPRIDIPQHLKVHPDEVNNNDSKQNSSVVALSPGERVLDSTVEGSGQWIRQKAYERHQKTRLNKDQA